MNIDLQKWPMGMLYNGIKKYDETKYWKMRAEVVDPNSRKPKWVRLWYLYRIKKSDAFNCASMGTDLGRGASFKTPPILMHGLNGILISHFAAIGANCVIYQQVTVAGDEKNRAAVIGDNCLIGAGARIIGNVKIGDNVKIGANAVVVRDVPSDCTAVGVPARIIPHKPAPEKAE